MVQKIANIPGYSPHENQIRFHTSQQKRIVIVAPSRSGKTEGLKYDILMRAWNNPSPYAIMVGAPTYGMVTELIELPLLALCNKITTPNGKPLLKKHSVTPRRKIVLQNNREIYFVTLDKDAVDNAVRGLNISDIYVDEAALVDEYSIEVIKFRLLTTGGRLIFASTPKGTANHLYIRYFKEKNLEPTFQGIYDGTEYIRYKIFDNPIITQEAVDEVAKDSDPLLYRQEVLGEFVNLFANRVYYTFGEANITDSAVYDPELKVYIGLDFNIGKNAWVAFQKHSKSEIWAIDEGFGALDTKQVAYQIYAKYPDAIIIPDATGGNRLQGVAETQFQLLRQAGINNIAENRSNPDRLKRYSVVNSFFENALGQHLIKISRKRCPETIMELQTLTYKQGTSNIETLGDRMGHRTDAFGYAIMFLSGEDIARIRDASTDFIKNFKRRAKQTTTIQQQSLNY